MHFVSLTQVDKGCERVTEGLEDELQSDLFGVKSFRSCSFHATSLICLLKIPLLRQVHFWLLESGKATNGPSLEFVAFKPSIYIILLAEQ